MIYIQKNKTPQYLSDYVDDNPTADYDTDTFRPFIPRLREDLIKEQKGLCAYCCSRIKSSNSHNEHIEPRHGKRVPASKRSLDYTNIVASCNSLNTCGNHKGNEYDAGSFVSPLQADCEDKFSYDPDGHMNGDEYTINLLNLNSYELKRARKSIYKAVISMSEEDVRLVYCSDKDNYWPYSNVIFYVLNRVFH